MSNFQPFIKIVCEGQETEPNYFNAWLRFEGYKLPTPAFKPKDHSPMGVAREAKRCYNDAIKLGIPSELRNGEKISYQF